MSFSFSLILVDPGRCFSYVYAFMNAPTWAMAATLREESRWLRLFLEWHFRAGADRAYLYLDGEDSETRQILEAYPRCTITPCTRDRKAQHLTYFQADCMERALAQAREDGIDWLLFIDPDEFAWGADMNDPSGAALDPLLSSVPAHIQQILLAPLEVIPLKSWAVRPFWEELYVMTEHNVDREIPDPLTREPRLLNRWIGHRMGKALLRTSADAVVGHGPHSWTGRRPDASSERLPLPTMRAGCHLHVPVLNGDQWKEKFSKFIDDGEVYPGGFIREFPKSSWVPASVEMDESACRDYVFRHVSLAEDRIREAEAAGLCARAYCFEQCMKAMNAERWINEREYNRP